MHVTIKSDDDLREGLATYFDTLSSYARSAAQRCTTQKQTRFEEGRARAFEEAAKTLRDLHITRE